MGKKNKVMLVSSSWEELSLGSSSIEKKPEIICSNSDHYPLGLAYIHSYLETKGYSVETLWLNNCSFDYCFSTFIDNIERYQPDYIGLQMLTPNRVSSYRLIEYLHIYYPNIIIIVGGIHASIMYRQLLQKYPFILIIIGEGELTFYNLLEELSKNGANLNKVKGIAYYNDGIMITEEQDLIEDLDSIPYPKHELFITPDRDNACIITSRGCPNNCSFCCLNPLQKRRVRLRSIENVISEIEYLSHKFPQLKYIWIHDDTFFLQLKRVNQFCDMVIWKKIIINFICSGRVKPLSLDLVKKLEKANFVKVLLGLESADNKILLTSHKGITRNDVLNAVKLFSKTKIDIYAFIIIGLPGETMETIISTSKFVQKLQLIKYMRYSVLGILMVYPGTEIYEISKENGIIDDDYWLTDSPTPIFTVENSNSVLLQYKEIMRDYIAYEQILTKNGFIKQFFMLPSILWYILHRDPLTKILIFLERLKKGKNK